MRKTTSARRPDLTLEDLDERKICLVDVACRVESNIEIRNSGKETGLYSWSHTIRYWMFRRRNKEVRRTNGQADPRRTAETEKNKRDAENCTDRWKVKLYCKEDYIRNCTARVTVASWLCRKLANFGSFSDNKRDAGNCSDGKWNYCKEDYIRNCTAMQSDYSVVTMSKASKFW